MEVEISLRATIEQNAAEHFERAKRAKAKLEGARQAIAEMQARLEKLRREAQQAAERVEQVRQERLARSQKKREWFHKFRWFISSKGSLVLLGRDAATNEILVKKHTASSDIVFHSEGIKSPFCVVKLEGRELDEATKQEAAIATASFSEAWKRGLSEVSVFCVKPEQLSKSAKPGEFVARGAFVVYGKKEFIPARVGLAIGLTKENAIMCGPEESVRAHCKHYVRLEQGNSKASDAARQIQKRLGGGGLDEIIRALPTGGLRVL